MAMTSGRNGQGVSSEINVTPLIDVLLVLLILFMVIVPMVPKGLDAFAPQPARNDDQYDRSIVVSVLRTDSSQLQYRINQDVVSREALTGRLTEIYAHRAERVMFLKGDGDISYAQMAEVIDMGHSAGVDHVALMTPKVLQGL